MAHKRKVLQGSASNIARLLLSVSVSLVLPPFLVHHLPQAEYSAWVLILQLSAYVNLLDLGLQTAIGKFVAEYGATGNREASGRLVSTSLTMLLATALIGSGVIVAMTWKVPQLFHQMPAGMVPEVRLGLLIIGLSTAFSLPFSPFLSAFTGLQQYGFPTVLGTISRVVSAVVLILVLFLHGGLVALALVMGSTTLATAVIQFLGWRKYVREQVPISFLTFDRRAARQLAKYGGALSISMMSMLFVSGMDTLIVGHYDYKNTGFYAIGASVTNFVILLIANLFNPLLPAISSMQATSTPAQIGQVLIKVTRYCSLLLPLAGLPILFGGYPLLSLWVGHEYAAHSIPYLEILLIANILRQLGYPYSLVLVATGKQHLGTFTAVAEAAVNCALSIWLVQRMGAVGVAIGTLVGAFFSLGLHLIVSLHFSRFTILIQRSRFVLQGWLRPLLCIVPSLVFYPFWKRNVMLPINPILLIIWLVSTAAIAWKIGLTNEERRQIRETLVRIYMRFSLLLQ
jgi:O-antigen/teichoic acid export membrane protein